MAVVYLPDAADRARRRKLARDRDAQEQASIRYPAIDRQICDDNPVLTDDKPVLVSPENPQGWDLADLLFQLHREIEARHRAMTFASATTAVQSLAATSKLLGHIRDAEIQQLIIDHARHPPR